MSRLAVDLRIGDALELARALPDASVDSIVCDPPYELGFMGKAWDKSGIAFHVELWAEALRVLKPGGHLLAFSATRTYHRLACAIEDAGFEIRDQLAWTYGSGMPKSRNLGDGWGTQVKPAWEPIAMARKPFKGTVDACHKAHGTGGLNIDACRIETVENLNGGAYSTGGRAAAMTGDEREGAALGMFQPGAKAAGAYVQPAGRWPANILHDGSDEVLAQFPADAGGKANIRGDEPSLASTGNVTNIRERVAFTQHDGLASAARFFYCAKASTAEREAGLEAMRMQPADTWEPTSQRGKRDAVQRRNHHPTVKPIAVGRWLQRLVTPPGGTTLDLFAGSGTFGCSAILEGFRAILFERDRDDAGEPLGYEAIILARLAWAAKEAVRERDERQHAEREAAFRASQLSLIA